MSAESGSMHPNVKLSFVFEEHKVSPEQASVLTKQYVGQMEDAFIQGQLNICVIEDYDSRGIITKKPVYPTSAVDFDIKLIAKGAYEEEIKRIGIKNATSSDAWEIFIRMAVRLGLTPSHLHGISILQAVDELNTEGYQIGLVYEEGIKFSDRLNGFLAGTLPLGFPAYKRLLLELMDITDIRDRKLIKQITRLIESSNEHPINIFTARGLLHGRMLEFLPSEYQDRVIFAVSNIIEEPRKLAVDKLEMILKSDRRPTEEEWLEAYEQYNR